MARNVTARIRNLQRRNARRRQATLVLEGVRIVEEALAAGLGIEGAAVSPALDRTDRGRALRRALGEYGVELEEIPDVELGALADTDTPQGIVAIAAPREWTLADFVTEPPRPVAVLDGVQDPGNVGTILRSARALGAGGVIALPGTAILSHPKVVRAAAGATFRLPAVRASVDETVAWCRATGRQIWVASRGGEPVRTAPRVGAVALVLGNEGAGVDAAWREQADRVVEIPMAPDAESLNVAIAAGILLYEVCRD